MTSRGDRADEHNLRQRLYYERPDKPNLEPADSPYLNRHVEELMRFAGIRAGNRVLEVGCGMGRYTLLLARRGVAVEGLDLTPCLLERLREHDGGRYGIPLHCADVSDHLPELEGRFDNVVGFFTLHHLHDLARCFGAMTRLVKPGGRVAFLEPNAYNPLYYVQVLLTPGMTWRGDRGIVRMRRGPVFGAMGGAGLVRLATERFGFFPPFLSNSRSGARVEAVLERVPVWRAILPFLMFRGDRP